MVTVLIAVYNGEKYLKQQIESILTQTFTDVKIVIRDDGSTDNSINIINDYCNKYPEKICSIIGEPTGSAAENFAVLLDSCDDDYIMFCDQDDVWLPQKIEKTLEAMKNAEDGKQTPVLVHSDLKVVDGELNVISNSLFKFKSLKQHKLSLCSLLVQNYITGCTVMINRALKQKCGKIPKECIMHDWWLGLVAQLFGKIVCLNESTILYRQHADNQVGDKVAYGLSFVKQKLSTLDKVRKIYNSTYVQANALIDNYGTDLDGRKREAIEKYCRIENMGKLKKIYTAHKFGFKKCTFLRVVGQYIVM